MQLTFTLSRVHTTVTHITERRDGWHPPPSGTIRCPIRGRPIRVGEDGVEAACEGDALALTVSMPATCVVAVRGARNRSRSRATEASRHRPVAPPTCTATRVQPTEPPGAAPPRQAPSPASHARSPGTRPAKVNHQSESVMGQDPRQSQVWRNRLIGLPVSLA